MDFQQTEIKKFIDTFQLFNKRVPNEPVRRSYNSVCSHWFIKFGDEIDDKLPNGRPYKKSPWTIWLGANVDWRLSQNGKFIVGSCQPYEQMNTEIKRLIGKKYLSCSIISQMMDIQLEFEEGYQITSFLNVLIRKQWTLFCQNGDTAGLEAETLEQVKQIQKLSSHFDIQNLFKEISLPINQKYLTHFSIEETDLHLHFESDLTLCLNRCIWRIEKNKEYCIGSGEFSLDEHPDIHQYLDGIKGKKLVKSFINQPFKDAQFEFENGLIIKTFSCFKDPKQWSILKKDQDEVYSANIVLN